MITNEEIAQYRSEIDDAFARKDWATLFDVAKKLYRDTDNKYGYFLGACYLNSWGVQQDNEYAGMLFTTAAEYGDTYDYACYMAALAYYRQRKFMDSYKWFRKAEEAGVRDSLALYADAAAGCAMDLWNMVRVRTLQTEVTQGVAVVKEYMADAINKYMQAAEENLDSMNTALFCGYARMLILMYNMSTTGLLDTKVVRVDSLAGMVVGGLEAMQKMMDTGAHDETLANCVVGAHFLEHHGQQLLAEYLRAFLALMESTRDRSAAAFYRARWHMKRIGELRGNAPEAQLLADSFPDLDTLYQTAEKKYGATVLNMMSSGQLPDLTKSFLPGQAPAVESCGNFMELFHSVRSRAQQPAKKTGGLLRNLFGF